MKHTRGLVVLLICVTIASVALAAWAVFIRDGNPTLLPDTPPGIEDNAVPTGDGDQEKMPQAEGGGAVNITWSGDVTISLAQREATLSFENPSRSNQSMVLQLEIHDTAILRSGLLPPGYAVETLPLSGEVGLQEGTYEGHFRIYFYEPDDNTEAVLNTTIPVSVYVVP